MIFDQEKLAPLPWYCRTCGVDGIWDWDQHVREALAHRPAPTLLSIFRVWWNCRSTAARSEAE